MRGDVGAPLSNKSNAVAFDPVDVGTEYFGRLVLTVNGQVILLEISPFITCFDSLLESKQFGCRTWGGGGNKVTSLVEEVCDSTALFLFFSEADNFDPVYLSIHDARESTMFTDFI